MLPDELRRAANLIRTGRAVEARPILARFVQQHPESEQGWLLLSMVLRDRAQQMDCLARVLTINPENALARERMSGLQFEGRGKVAAAPARQGMAADQPAPPHPGVARDRQPGKSQVQPTAPDKMSEAPARAAASGMPRKRAAGAEPAAAPPKAKKRGGGVWIALLLILGLIALAVVVFVGLQILQTLQSPSGAPGAATSVGGGQPLPPTWTATLTPTETPVPSATPRPTLTPTPTLEPPDPTISAMMDRIEAEVADIRGLESSAPVTRYVVSRSGVRPILEAEFQANGGSREEMDDEARVLSALGLIKPTYDMYTNALNGLTDNLGGFFFPWSDEVYVIGSRFGGVEHFVYSHEYAHALVDQTFQVDAQGVYPECLSNSDRCRAIKALVEGDATLVMGLWWRQYSSPSDYQDIQNYVPPQSTLPEQYPPEYVLLDSEFPYLQGLDFVTSLHDAGNWPAVNRAYERWPESTEQILHPEKYRAGEGPQGIALPAMDQVLGDGWRKLSEDTLGEWGTYLLLGYGADLDAALADGVAATAARGWGGDRYQVYYHDEDELAVLAALSGWDTVQDATQFRQAMTEHLGMRFRQAELDSPTGACWQVNQQTTCLYLAGRQVLWLMGPDMGTVNLVRALFPAF
jgi:hypothetical protein